MAPGDLDRGELIELVGRIMRGGSTIEEEEDRLVRLFEESVAHPAAADLIFHPREHFGDVEPTAEQVVDAALAYRPIELGPASG